ncbi:MAG TPA: ABC transporter ATP-binding protein, partial [Candidatus Limnocylindrales bacterium]|nr:ABC transporter ATP-binding protein [Candidatus Limnocylindrales bacterium]
MILPTPPGSASATLDRPTSRPSTPAVTVRGLTKRFGPVLALDRLDLEVPAGSVFGLLGPNGAGKTTTIRILTGLARPSAGEAVVLGRPPVDAAKGGGIGYMPQEPRFYGWMRGRELLDLVGRLHGLPDGERRTRVADALEQAGLADAADRRIGGYSGGMRQRLGIAQALLHS